MEEQPKIKVFLDDQRDPKVCFGYLENRVYLEDDWKIVRNYDEFKKLVQDNYGRISIVSFDHDLFSEHYDIDAMCDEVKYNALYAGFKEKTGLDCARFLKQAYEATDFDLPEILIHSMNPVGAKNIKQVFQ